MELVNATPLAADSFVTELEEGIPRIGMVLAKATFTFDEAGEVELDRDDPFPVFREDEETDHGVLPGDLVVRDDPGFEVILLGEAIAPEERPAESMYVTLALGETVQHLLVTGDRWWHIALDEAGEVIPEACVPTPPQPFLRMPLGWGRAFGGRTEVLIDAESPLEFMYPLNPEGLGFDPEPSAREFAASIHAPEGYPVIERVRALPNVEDPEQPIGHWSDAPEPAGWGTLPGSSTLRMQRLFADGEKPEMPPPPRMHPKLLHRAHPDWVISLPESGSRVFLRGLVPGAPELSLSLPRMRVFVDYTVGEREGSGELRPHMLALLPGERRFYLLYRLLFNFAFDPMSERCLRLRTAEGWFGDP